MNFLTRFSGHAAVYLLLQSIIDVLNDTSTSYFLLWSVLFFELFVAVVGKRAL